MVNESTNPLKAPNKPKIDKTPPKTQDKTFQEDNPLITKEWIIKEGLKLYKQSENMPNRVRILKLLADLGHFIPKEEIKIYNVDKMSVRDRFDILHRDKYTCQYCGREAPKVKLHIDHKTPISKGGTNEVDNLITSCQDCNMGKGNRYDTKAEIIHRNI